MKKHLTLFIASIFLFTLGFVSAEVSNINCTDTDGGLDFFNFGTLINHSITGTNLVDVCLTGSDYLFERHCESSDPNNYTVLVDCADFGATCENGACIPEPSNATCVDSDGGLDIFESGILTLSNDHSSGTLEDTCTGIDEGLAEYVCLADGCGYQVVYPSTLRLDPKYMLVYDNGNCEYATANWGYNVDCATEGNVCIDGACVPELEPTCSNLGGEICEAEEYCQGINMTDSNEAKCCDGVCKPVPTWAICGQCGHGLFNNCDRNECETLNPIFPSLNYGCVFTPLVDDSKGTCTDCTPEWECSEWSQCMPLNSLNSGYGQGYGYGFGFFETRECVDVNSCKNSVMPEVERNCVKPNENSGNNSRFFWDWFD